MEFKLKDLKESNDFLNRVLENITSGVLIIDKEVQVYSFNDTVKALLENPDEKVIGKLCGNALGCIHTVREDKKCGHTTHCKDCSLRHAISTTFSIKNPVTKKKLKRKFKINGKIIKKIYQYSTRYIKFHGEEMVLIIIDDITNQELRQRKLKRLNELKNKFLGIAAHDIKNPISIILTLCEMAKKSGKPLEVSGMDAIQEIINSAEFINDMINNLLDITAIESGTISLSIEKINYTQLVEKNIKMNKMIAGEKGINLTLENNTGNVYLSIDRNKIEQVLNNLIYNAIKFSDSGSEIKVILSKKDNYIKTEVIDEGKGIKADEIGNLFLPFKKTSTKATNNEKGTGLGLAIVKKIVDIHNGEITVKSKSGEGSNFTYYLPYTVKK
jgi:signal transduction histidine kinase